jgi:hypothetical protein
MIHSGAYVLKMSSNDDVLDVELEEGGTISFPLTWHPRLLHASQKDRDDRQIAGGGFGIHWPSLDEDLRVDGLLCGAPAPRVRVLSSHPGHAPVPFSSENYSHGLPFPQALCGLLKANVSPTHERQQRRVGARFSKETPGSTHSPDMPCT